MRPDWKCAIDARHDVAVEDVVDNVALGGPTGTGAIKQFPGVTKSVTKMLRTD